MRSAWHLRYGVVVYHDTENGFDESQDYQTLAEAKEAAQKCVNGLEPDGFAYDGAGIYDRAAQKYVRYYGDFPDTAVPDPNASQQPIADLKVEVETWDAEQADQKQAVIDGLPDPEQVQVIPPLPGHERLRR